MQQYIGVKLVTASPMTRLEYNDYRGWTVPEDEDPSDAGFLVEYQDGGDGNHPGHDGYISWCHKEQFEAANRPVDGLSFGHAIEAAKQGLKITRKGWNGNGMFVFLRDGRFIKGVPEGSPMGGDFESLGHFCMRTADGKCCVGWLASQTDKLSDDWQIVE